MDLKKERVVIFIDGSNMYHLVKRLLPKKKMINFNFEKFVNFIAQDNKLVRAYYYTSPLDRKFNEETYMKQQQFFDKLRRITNFELTLCRMQKVKIDGKIIYQVKEDDIHLAVDMVKLAYNNAYDRAILISSDGDFVPAIVAVKQIGKNVDNIGFENTFSYHLQQKCDSSKILKKEELEEFFEEEK